MVSLSEVSVFRRWKRFFVLVFIVFSAMTARAEGDALMGRSLSDAEVYAKMAELGVKEPLTVLAQAKIETGNWKSRLCVRGNNILGIKTNGRYGSFGSVDECIEAYLSKIQCRYREGRETYYGFLKRIKYAQNPKYIATVKEVERKTRKALGL